MFVPCNAANEAFEKVSSYGLTPTMIFYLLRYYGYTLGEGANVIFLWSAASNFSPILGAIISDAYLGRYLTIGIGSIFSLMVNFSLIQFSCWVKFLFSGFYIIVAEKDDTFTLILSHLKMGFSFSSLLSNNSFLDWSDSK